MPKDGTHTRSRALHTKSGSLAAFESEEGFVFRCIGIFASQLIVKNHRSFNGKYGKRQEVVIRCTINPTLHLMNR